MELKIKQAIELGETLIKHYKYAIKLYTKGGSIRLNQDYSLVTTQNNNLFLIRLRTVLTILHKKNVKL